MLRLHCQLGDYFLALKTLEPIELNKSSHKRKAIYSQVSGCYITLYYYLGFSYLMTRRYVDAIKTFSIVLLYILRTKQFHSTSSHQFDQLSKKNEQINALLAITVSLCPQRIDEAVHSDLRNKYSDKLGRLQRGDDSAFRELFIVACPKFISPAPQYGTVGQHRETAQLSLEMQHQLDCFLKEVEEQKMIPTLRSYLKLYTSIKTSKLAHFLETDEEKLRTYLMCVKHKTHNIVWNGGSPASGSLASSSDVAFFVDQDMVHIANTKVSRRCGEFFIKQIIKLDDLVRQLE